MKAFFNSGPYESDKIIYVTTLAYSCYTFLLFSCDFAFDSFANPWTVRLLCPWDFPDKNTRVGCHYLLQGIFPTQGFNTPLLHWQVDSLPPSHQGSPCYTLHSVEYISLSIDVYKVIKRLQILTLDFLITLNDLKILNK